MKEEKPLRILLAEDLPADAELAEKEIRKSGIEFTARRVDTKGDFLKALEKFRPDLIVSDYKMPEFDGMQALRLSLKHDSTIPFIILTGSMNEETAVECMKAGAANYVIKEHIARLPFAVKEALEQKKMRLAKEEAEQALRESERRLKEAQRLGRIGHWEFDLGTQRILWSDMTFVLYERDPKLGPPTAKEEAAYYSAEDAERLQNCSQRTIDTGEPYEVDVCLRLPGGRLRYAVAIGTPVKDAHGRVVRLLGTIQDITERKQAEELLKSSEDRLRILFEYAPDAYYLNDLKGTFVDGNKAAEELTGYRKEELIGSNFLNLHLLQPHQLVKASSLLAQNFLGRPTGPDEFILKRKDGSEVTVEIRTFPVKVKDKTLVLGIARDITERKQTEKQVTLLAHTVKSIIECVSITDLNDKILFVNDAFLTTYGYEESEILGKDITIVRPPNAPPEALREIREATLGGGWHGELMNRTKDGREFPVLLSTSTVRDDTGQTVGLVGVATDITERRQVEEALRHEKTLLDALMNNIPDSIYFKDRQCRMVRINRKMMQDLKLDDVSQAIGKTDVELFGEEFGRKSLASDERLMAMGKPIVGLTESWQLENGQLNWASTTKVPLRDDSGQIVGLVGITREINELMRAHEEREHERNLLRTLIDNLPDNIFIKDTESRFVVGNTAVVRQLGFAAEEELIGKTDFDLFPRELAARFYAEEQAIIQSGKGIYDDEAPAADANKEEKDTWVSTTKVPLRDAQGKIMGIVGIGRYITERKRAEELLKQHERQLKEAQRDARLGSWEWNALTDVTTCSDELYRLFDKDSKEFKFSLNVFLEAPHPDDRKVVENHVQQLFQTHRPTRFDYRVIMAAGEIRWLHSRTTTTVDDAGRLVSMQGTVQDVTERKRAEEVLRESEEKYRDMVEQINDVIFSTDTNGILTYISPTAEILGGYKPEEMIGHSMGEFLDPLFLPKIKEQFQKVMTGILESVEYRVKIKSGEYRWVRSSSRPILKENKPIGMRGVLTEITERKRAEEELIESKKIFSDMFQKSPVTIVLTTPNESIILDVNETFLRDMEYTRDEVIGHSLVELGLLDDLNDRQQILNILKDKRMLFGYECRFRTKSGKIITALLSIVFIKQKGKICQLNTVIDISERKRAEEKLKKNEEKYRSIFDNVAEGIFQSTPDGKFLTVNPAMARILGFSSPEELIRERTDIARQSYVHPEQREEFKRLMEQQNRVSGFEYEVPRKDGSLAWVSETAQAIRDATGRIVHYEGVFIDITERKRAEEALRYERLLLRTLIDNIPDSIYSKDLSCRKTLANLAEVRNIGVKSEAEVLGKDDFEFFPKELAEGFFADDQSVLRTGQPVLNREEYVLDEKGQKRWLLTSKLALRDKEGHIKGLVGIGRDVTERKQAEEALKKSEEQYRQFFEDDLTGDYVSTPEGKILSCNPAFARIYGFASVEEALKADTYSLYTELEEREIFLRLLKERRKLEYYESEYLRRDGTHVYCVENAVGIFDQQENLVQIRGYIFDDTKRKTLERQLIQAQKLESLGTLASGIAHDFNNILGIILGYASLLTRGEPDPENIKSSADAVIRASQRGAALVKQLLTFARKVDVQLQSVRLNDIVNEISKLLSETFAKTLEISLHLEKDLPTITGDPTQIHQVLLNLCVNARDAMPKGGTIGITTSCQQGETIRAKFPRAVAHKYVVLRVADTGVGMDEMTRSRIFEPFFTTKEIGKGTGLGLSVVFGILESHNGFVDVESKPGKGTTFHLYFPVLQSKEIEQAKAEIEREILGGTETLLVVEDEELLRELLRTSLRSAGYTVFTAVDGQEAVDLFDQHQDEIQLVLSDVGLPKLTGYDVFRKMKRTKPNLKFILASGFIEPQLKSEIFKEGLGDFVQKPYSVYEVLKAIRSLLDQK